MGLLGGASSDGAQLADQIDTNIGGAPSDGAQLADQRGNDIGAQPIDMIPEVEVPPAPIALPPRVVEPAMLLRSRRCWVDI